MKSAWYFKEPLRNQTQNFLISKLCFPWLGYTLTPSNSTHYYLTSSNLLFTTKTTKKFPAEQKTTENLRAMTRRQQTSHPEPIMNEFPNIFDLSLTLSNGCMTSTKLGIVTSLQPAGIFTFVTWLLQTNMNDSNASYVVKCMWNQKLSVTSKLRTMCQKRTLDWFWVYWSLARRKRALLICVIKWMPKQKGW